MAEHAWCRDVPRDEAVRAAEDNRPGPLPTLEEVIARQTARPCGGADPAPLGGEPGGAASDDGGLNPHAWGVWRELRDAAVCLPHCGGERLQRAIAAAKGLLTQPRPAVPASGAAERMAETVDRLEAMSQDPGRTVVWEEFDDAAGTKPVAWAFVTTDGAIVHVSTFEPVPGTATVVPLYAAPQPAPGWLTAEEREAIEWAADAAYDKQHPAEDTLRPLLARSTPPEVVLKDFTPDAIRNLDTKYLAGWDQCMALAKRAISAAGVTVKEVGRE